MAVHIISHGGFNFEYLCAGCEYRRDHPDAAPAVPLPTDRRALPLQSERLF